MSWYGCRGKISKAEAKQRLPPASCKLCVYFFRVFLKRRIYCSRCTTYRLEDGKLRGYHNDR